jgi:hypothetical protein
MLARSLFRRPAVRPVRPLLALLALTASLSLPAAAGAAPRHVAVIIGVGAYPHLDPSLALPRAAQQAMDLARVLEQEAGYDQVLPLVDAVATRAGIEGLLFEALPAQLKPEDLLLVYFAGHGIGADFGDPYLLPSDVDPADVQGTALAVSDLAQHLREAVPGAQLVILTDAVHDQRLGDLVLMGPNARTWPNLTGEFLSLSACGPRELPAETPFSLLVRDGLAGAADASGDGVVTSGELVRFVQAETAFIAGDAAHPVEGGDAGPNLALARVQRGPADFPAYIHERGWWTPRHIGGLVITGLGLGAGIAGLGLLHDANGIAPYVDPHPADRLPPPAGETYKSLLARYKRDAEYQKIAYIAGGALLLTGGTLVVWPTPDGVAVGVRTRF